MNNMLWVFQNSLGTVYRMKKCKLNNNILWLYIFYIIYVKTKGYSFV